MIATEDRPDKLLNIVTLQCLRCGHVWTPRKNTLPKYCPNPKCNSPYWNQPRRAKKSEDRTKIEQR